MARNGAGTYSLPPSNPVVTGTTIAISWANVTLPDIGTELTNSIARDGQSVPTANLPMGGFKHTGAGVGTIPGDSVEYSQLLQVYNNVCDFRLTLANLIPVPAVDVVGAATLYCTPYKGNRISLYNGAAWDTILSAQFSIPLAALNNARPYDVFCFNNAGVATLELLTWTNDTVRATALVLQDGVLVKSGVSTRRYLGTFYTTGIASSEDSIANRYLWNYYNRVVRPMRHTEPANTYAYTLFATRQANASVLNQLNMVVGVNEDMVDASIISAASNTNTGVIFGVGVGLDATGVISLGGLMPYGRTQVANLEIIVQAQWKGYVGVGRHFLSWNEFSTATGVTTWIGNAAAPNNYQSGIHGSLLG